MVRRYLHTVKIRGSIPRGPISVIFMSTKVFSMYKKLLQLFGSQRWWPADSSYEVVVGAILTQNTNWKNVEKAVANMKRENKLTEKAVLEMPVEELQRLIRPSGFYRQKSERLKLATGKWTELNGKSLPLETLRKEWLSVKGIGKETADSILLYAMGKPIFVIDAYTRRFCKQYLNNEFKEYDEYRHFFEKNLPPDVKLFREYHALIVTWGKEKRNGPGEI